MSFNPLYSRRTLIRSMVGGSLLWPGIVSELLAVDGAGREAAPDREAARAATSGAAAADSALSVKPPHYAPRAKRVIFLFSTGGVSHIDTFDPKPSANGRDGSGKEGLMGSLYRAQPNPRCGTIVTDLFPHIRGVLDEICVIRSMKSSHFDHSEATLGMHTGSATFARPSMGSWVSYGLGTFNQNLPSYLVLAPNLPYAGTQVYANDFLPAYHQGTRVVPGASPIDNLRPRTAQRALQQLELDLMGKLNAGHRELRPHDSELAARIKSFETAFEMQTAGPEAFDLNLETASTLSDYGLEPGQTTGFGWQCLVARRLAERGVRFIELIDTGSRPNWDSHSNMKEHEPLAKAIDQPIAALIKDLKARGMLDDTLIVWATEFGRTPAKEGAMGRGHHGHCFSIWLAGGGIKGGIVHGETDELGRAIVRDKVEVHDLHATILHLLGIDHTRLTYRHAGRDFRLTDVHGHVVKQILA